MKVSTLLTIKILCHLSVGLSLAFFPSLYLFFFGIYVDISFVGLRIIGGIITGIGLALIIERFQGYFGIPGLSSAGAACIDVCGTGMLIIFLMNGTLIVSLNGFILLSILSFITLVFNVHELIGSVKIKR